MDVMAWVRDRGVVLQSAHGPVPNVAEMIAGGPIKGSWWGHPAGHEIYAELNSVMDSSDVVATRLIGGKVTLIHRRVWPAIVRLADRFPADRLASVVSEHTPSGAHRNVAVPFPDWVPEDAVVAGGRLSTEEAEAMLPTCLRPPRGRVTPPS
jgi:hypothetical protein